MWYLYVDESGDLGFDFSSKKPSNYFTICVLLIRRSEHNKAIISAVNKTIRRKLSVRDCAELKGTRTSLAVKQYFYRQAQDIPFEIFALTLNKRRVYKELQDAKDRLYNFIARLVLERVPFVEATTRIELTMDRCKSTDEIANFNQYIIRQVQGRIDPRIPLHIAHRSSHEHRALQAVDLLSWGVFRSYEHCDRKWRDVFAEKIKYEDVYLK